MKKKGNGKKQKAEAGNTVKVKRCPFCNAHELGVDANAVVYWIACFECGASGPHSTSRARAVEYWNTGYANPSALVVNRKSNHHDLKEIEAR